MDYESIRLLFQAEHILVTIGALLFAGVFTFLSYRITNPPISKRKKGILIALRLCAFFLLFFSIFEPLFIGKKKNTIKPKLVALVDNSKSVAFNQDTTELRKKVDSVITTEGLDYSPQTYSFGDTISKLKDVNDLNFTENSSALGNALMEINQKYNPRNIGGVLLFSDGQTNLGESPLKVSANLQYPVYSIGVGSPTPPPDVSVARVIHNKVAYAGNPSPIKANIGSWELKEKSVPVFISSQGEVIASKKINLKEKGRYTSVEFELKPEEAGVKTYSIYIPKQENEFLTENNSRHFSLKVLPGKQKVLLGARSLSWEYTFLKRVLSDRKNIELSTFFSNNRLGSIAKFSNSAEKLSKYKGIILLDALDFISEGRNSKVLSEYLNKGGSVFLSTQSTLPEDIPGQVREKLPFKVKGSSGKLVEKDFVPDLTIQGGKHPITNLSDETGTSNEQIYSSLPPLKGFVMVKELKPGAKSLLVHPNLRDVPILSVFSPNAGKVVLFNGTPLWQWAFYESGMTTENEHYKMLMTNITKWLLAPEEMDPFQIKTNKRVYKGGEPIFINANLSNESGEPIVGANVDVKVTKADDDTSFKPITFSLKEFQKGAYSYKLQTLPQGKYRLIAEASTDKQEFDKKTASFMVEEYSLEYENLSLDKKAMKSVASYSDGEYSSLDDAGEVVSNLDFDKRVIGEEKEKNLWDHPILLILFVVFLATEWIIRRRADLL